MMLIKKIGTYLIIPEKELIIEYYSGKINVDDFINLKNIISKESAYNFYFNTILDVRDAVLELDDNDLVRLINFLEDKFGANEKRRLAYITSKPNHVVLTTLFSFLLRKSKDIKCNPEIFSTIDTTAKWLCIKGISKEKLNQLLVELKTKPNVFKT